MKRCNHCLCFLLLLAVAGLCADLPNSNPRSIVGGQLVRLEAYPFLVVASFEDGYCTGTIVSPNYILTAAHCAVDKNGQINASVFVNHGQGSNYKFSSRRVNRVIIHPQYNSRGTGFRHDIALLQVAKPFPQAYVTSLGIPSRDRESTSAVSGTMAVALGYGLIENDQDNDGLRSVKIPLLHPEDCRRQLRFQYELEIAHEDTLCAGFREKLTNRGDSGGPLVVSYSSKEGIQWLLVGVASMRARDRFARIVTAIFTRVSSHTEWIRKQTGGAVSIVAAPAIIPDSNETEKFTDQLSQIEAQIRSLQAMVRSLQGSKDLLKQQIEQLQGIAEQNRRLQSTEDGILNSASTVLAP